MRVIRAKKVSTTDLLTANSVYTSPAIDVTYTNQIRGRAFSAQGGSLALQQSDDGITWDTITTVTVTGGTVASVNEPCLLTFFRAVYTNGGTNQVSFRLTLYSDYN